MSRSPETNEPDRAAEDEQVYFDAILRPHRSLGPRGFLILMSAIGGVGFMVGLSFFLAGAWPIAGFCGLEILLVYWAFKMNFRDAQRAERVRLTNRGFEVSRLSPNGRVRREALPSGWLRVLHEDPGEGFGMSRLFLASHGRVIRIGAFLSGEELTELAAALRRALDDYRAPYSA